MAVIAYRKWDFKILGLGRKFSNSENRREVTYVRYPKELEHGDGIRRVLGPIDKLGERGVNKEN